jgi:hypothetical protein
VLLGRVLFTQKVQLFAAGGAFPTISNPFWIIPTLNGGDLALRICEHDPCSFTTPTINPEPWTVFNASINSDLGLAIVLRHQSGARLQLTSTFAPDPERATWLTGNWVASGGNPIINGMWTFTFLPSKPSVGPRLSSWTFLISPEGESAFAVTFSLLLVTTPQFTMKQQGESFPPGWHAQDIQATQADGVSMTIFNDQTKERHCLRTGRFSGGLGRLVCQGIIVDPRQQSCTDSDAQVTTDPTPPQANGNWTGTSSGP